jgi:lipoprotein-anchoring transpeptidase ErfK/SrfK
MYCVAAVVQPAPAISKRHVGTRFRRFVVAGAAIAALLGGATYARAGVLITVNKSTQRLSVAVDGKPRYVWPVSTARRGYSTPNGTYRPERLERKWFSRKYDWSPMPHSIFFDGGYAIHGSYEISHLGRPASHGYIRLHPKHAAVLFSLVERNRDATRIVVTGERQVRSVYSDRTVHSARSRRAEQPVRYYRARTRHARETFEEIFDNPPSRYARGVYYFESGWYR